jgi:ankyrin repeat protein
MSSTAVLGFINDINSKNLKAVNDRLKKEKPNQRYSDPKAEGLVYTLLHAAVATGSHEMTAALLKAGADVNAKDSKGKTPLTWLAPHVNSEPHLKVAGVFVPFYC